MSSNAHLPSIAEPDNDPRLWLETLKSDDALAWVKAQNDRTLADLNGETLEKDKEAVRAALERPDHIPYVDRIGGLLYNCWTDEKNKRGLWRRTTLESYRSDNPDWDVLLDLDKLALEENQDWVWRGPYISPSRRSAILRLSRGGADAVTLREFDLERRQFVLDGFNLPEAYSYLNWLDSDTVLLASTHGSPLMAARSQLPRTIRKWCRGKQPDTAEVLFECPVDHVRVSSYVDRTGPDGSRRIRFVDFKSYWNVTRFLSDMDGLSTRLDIPADARPSFAGDHLVVVPRTPWTLADKTYAPDTVLAFSLSKVMGGVYEPTVLFEPTRLTNVESFQIVSGCVVLSILDNLRPIIQVLTPPPPNATPGTRWNVNTMPGLPPAGKVSVEPLDEEPSESDGSLLVRMHNPITPATLSLSSTDCRIPTALYRAPATFDAKGLVVECLEAKAEDGESIPYTITRPAGDPTGDAPVCMLGYGGFEHSNVAQYSSVHGLLWLARGGTTVFAHIRGGGELGARWHEAGRGAFKSVSHNDFAAIATDLVSRGITRPERIAAEGSSNGGLLIANMLTRHPDKFGALTCAIPLTDMRRYTALPPGSAWIAEYGDPEKAADWEHLQHISAYHNVASPTVRTPAILVTTSRGDDRVHPAHARKFAAKLQENGANVLFYETDAGGHGSGADMEQVAASKSLAMLFLRKSIGWETELSS